MYYAHKIYHARTTERFESRRKKGFLARQKANKPRPCWDPFNYYWGCRNLLLTDSPRQIMIKDDRNEYTTFPAISPEPYPTLLYHFKYFFSSIFPFAFSRLFSCVYTSEISDSLLFLCSCLFLLFSHLLFPTHLLFDENYILFSVKFI